MNPLRRAGNRLGEAVRGASPASDCPRCEPLRWENEALQQEMEHAVEHEGVEVDVPKAGPLAPSAWSGIRCPAS